MPFKEFFYSVNPNKQVMNDITAVAKILKMISDGEHDFEFIKNCNLDGGTIINILNQIIEKFNSELCTIEKRLIIKSVCEELISSTKKIPYDQETCDTIAEKFIVIGKLLELENSDDVDSSILINFGYRLRYGLLSGIKHVPQAYIKNMFLCSMDEQIVSIKASTNYVQTTNAPQLTSIFYNPEELAQLIISSTDETDLIALSDKLYDYYESIKHVPGLYLDNFKTLVLYLYEKFINNITGLNRLESVLTKIVENISFNEISVSMCDDLYNMEYFCNETIDKIKNLIKVIENKNISVSSDPICELGLGMIDFCINNLDLSDQNNLELLKEEASKLDIYAINESLISSIIKDSSDASDFKNQDKINRYNRRQAVRNAREEALEEYQIAKATRGIKKKQARLEEKDNKELAKKESKERKKETNVNTLGEKIKTWANTTRAGIRLKNIGRHSANVLAAGATSALLGVNPLLGAGLYGGKLNMDKKNHPMRERIKNIADIENQLQDIDSKIDEANDKGNKKAVYELEKMKQKLIKTYNTFVIASGR